MLLSRPEHEVKERSAAIRADFKRRYDLNVLREQLFNEQSGTCAICKQPMQSSDSIIGEVDHAISIMLYVTWDFTIEEACEHANNRRNLLAVHTSCNRVKSGRDYEEFISLLDKGEVSLGSTELTTEMLNEYRRKLSERNRRNGRKGGRKAVESGQLARARELPQYKIGCKKGGRTQGPINGRRMVESGQLASLRTPEHQRKAGRVGGSISGPINGRKNVESGTLAKARHFRWHVERNRPNPRCMYCSIDGLVVAFG